MVASDAASKPDGELINVFPDDYRESEGIHVPKIAGESFGYTDGDVQEDYLLRVVRQASDRSLFSSEIVRSIRDWNSDYHLSPKRANLLRPFAATLLRSRVLEVGAGCGAITRYLGELGAHIVAVEGSYRRAQIARERTADLYNVEIVADRLQDFSSRELFDVVVVVGVLEYSRIYMKGTAEPEKQFLSRLGRLLNSDGIIVLAIENKLGLKYLAGALEDHLGAPFAGINDTYANDSVVTFGKAELSELLADAGFNEQRWYVPCPDYKLPTTILSPTILSGHRELAAALLAQSTTLDPQRPADPSFSLEQAWSVIEKNQLTEHLANSFLVVAGRSPACLTKVGSDKSIAWHYATDRHPAFTKEAQFVAQENGIVVQRSHLSPAPPPAVPLECVIESERYIEGLNWWRALSAIVNKAGWSVRDIADWAQPWIDALAKECGLATLNGETFRAYVNGRYFDATPFNLIREPDGAFRFIDQEWRLRPDVEFGFLMFRGFRDSLLRMSSSAAPAPNIPANVNLLITAVLAELGVMVTKIELDRFSLLERQVQAWVQGRTAEDVSDDWIANTWNAAMRPRAPLERAALIEVRDAAVAERAQAAEQLHASEAALAQTRNEVTAAREEASRHARNLQQDRDRLAAELDMLRPALDELLRVKAQLAAGEEKLAQTRNDVVAVRDEATRHGQDRDRLAAELEAAKPALAELPQLREHIGAIEQALAQARNETASVRDEAARQAQGLYRDLHQDRERLAAELEVAKAALAEMPALKAQITAAEETLTHARGELAASREELSRQTGERERLTGELKTSHVTLAQRHATVTRLTAEVDAAAVAVTRTEKERDAARLYLRESQGEVQNLAGELDAAREEVARRTQEFQHERARMQSDTAAMAREFTVARTRVRTLQTETERVSAAAASARDGHRAALAAHDAAQAEVARQQVRATELAAGLDAARDAAAYRERRMQELSRDVAAAQERAANAEAEAARLSDSVSEARNALAAQQNAAQEQADAVGRELSLARAFAAELEATVAAQARHLAGSANGAAAGKTNGAVPVKRGVFDAFAARLSRGKSARQAALRWEHEAIRHSRLFDGVWYLKRNPDVAAADADPLWHYLLHGAAEGRAPHPLFDSAFYRAQAPDLAESRMTPLTHYISIGVAKGLEPHPLFDTDWYLTQNPDVGTTHVNPLHHYFEIGGGLGLDPHPLFDSSWYLEQNPDVARAKDNPLHHYLEHGAKEGRNPSSSFDTDWYSEKYRNEIPAGRTPLIHYVTVGTSAGHKPSGEHQSRTLASIYETYKKGAVSPELSSALSHRARAAIARQVTVHGKISEAITNQRGVCIYVVYTDRDDLHLHHKTVIRAFKEIGYSVVVINNYPANATEFIRAAAVCSDVTICRENLGRDFGAWADFVVMNHERLAHATNVILLNDSLLGPTSHFEGAMKIAEKPGHDIFGLSESYQNGYHLQSSFLLLKSYLFADERFLRWFSDYPLPSEKEDVIKTGEIGFSAYMVSRGFRLASLVGYRQSALWAAEKAKLEIAQAQKDSEGDLFHIADAVNYYNVLVEDLAEGVTRNPQHAFWDTLLALGYPFVKRELFTHNPEGVPQLMRFESILSKDKDALASIREVRDRLPIRRLT